MVEQANSGRIIRLITWGQFLCPYQLQTRYFQHNVTYHRLKGCFLFGRIRIFFLSVPALLVLLVLMPNLALADYAAGLAAFNRGDLVMAAREWRGPAEEGDMKSQIGMGTLHENGFNGTSDPFKALRWYKMAAAQNSAEAKYNIGRIYAGGFGVERDLTQASLYWLEAAKVGHAPSAYNLGVIYYRGEGVKRDVIEGEAWFRRAARGGFANAQYMLGEILRLGVNGPIDLEGAREWLSAAAQQGFSPATSSLAALDNEETTAKSIFPLPNTVLTSSSKEQATQENPQLNDNQVGTFIRPADSMTLEQAAIAKAKRQTVSVSTQGQLLPPAIPSSDTDKPLGRNLAQSAAISVARKSLSTAYIPIQPAKNAPNHQQTPSSSGQNIQNLQRDDAPGAEQAALGRQQNPKFGLWLASFPQRVEAEFHWRELQGRFPDLLGDLSPSFERIDLGGTRGMIVRLFAGPLNDNDIATDICILLKRRVTGTFCEARSLKKG